ncbi:hypothetical protein PIB30_011859 [Stylosanthes scabra]|uniref:Aminotransferase-like plant mobile domain-containing protein n=1 Tax=Stylosanthes scabra TaxID=79078 RepID=A0ABU6T801_9FABA|nr:hypothetical protein [Stylosanthes scabra]
MGRGGAGQIVIPTDRVLHSRQMLLPQLDERAREYLDLVGFGHVAYLVPFEHDWTLASAVLERCLGSQLLETLLVVVLVIGQDITRAEASFSCVRRRLDIHLLSWELAVLAFLYRQMCHAMSLDQRNLARCIALVLSWAYYHILAVRPGGFVGRRFPLVARVVCPLLCFAIVEWHQVDRVVRQLSGYQHIPRTPLILDDMHGMDGRLGRGEWYPDYLSGWYGLWRDKEDNLVPIDHTFDVRPSRRYLQWYFQWELVIRLTGSPVACSLREALGLKFYPREGGCGKRDGRAPGRRGRRGARQGHDGRANDDDDTSPPPIFTQQSHITRDDGSGPSHVQHAEPAIEVSDRSRCYEPALRSQSSPETAILTHDGAPLPGTMSLWLAGLQASSLHAFGVHTFSS